MKNPHSVATSALLTILACAVLFDAPPAGAQGRPAGVLDLSKTPGSEKWPAFAATPMTAGELSGCWVAQAPPDARGRPGMRRIHGECLGHDFETFREDQRGTPFEGHQWLCELRDSAPELNITTKVVQNCVVDGRPRATFPISAATALSAEELRLKQAAAAARENEKQAAVAKVRADAAHATALQRYPELLASTRAKGNGHRIVFGIILGEQWLGVQDLVECELLSYPRSASTPTSIPFCSHGEAPGRDGKRWAVTADIDETRFDTSWVAFVGGGNGAVEVGVLPDGTVGRIRFRTYRAGDSSQKVVAALASKFGNGFSSKRINWDDGSFSYIHEWKLDSLTVVFHEVEVGLEGAGGRGRVSIFTPAWDKAMQDEERSKPPKL